MGQSTVWENLKEWIAGVSFKEWIAGVSFTVFLWGIKMTRDEYWLAIYKGEKARLDNLSKLV
jgi:hypothetical protein